MYEKGKISVIVIWRRSCFTGWSTLHYITCWL